MTNYKVLLWLHQFSLGTVYNSGDYNSNMELTYVKRFSVLFIYLLSRYAQNRKRFTEYSEVAAI